MLKFPFGLPRRLIQPLANNPVIGDIQQMLTDSMERNGGETGISWNQDHFDFCLVVKHKSSQLLWKLLSGKGLAAQVIWSSNETNLRTVYAQVTARCNDVVKSLPTGQPPGADRSDEAKTAINRQVNDPTANRHTTLQPTGNSQRKPENTISRWLSQGDLSCVRVPYLLQGLNQNKCSGLLRLVTDDDAADIYLENGSIIHATAPSTNGTDTIMEVFSWESGQYTFDCNGTTNERTISHSLDALQQMDMQLLFQATELERLGVRPTSYMSRQRDRLGDGALEDLIQRSAAVKRTFMALSQPITVAELIHRLRIPRAQLLPALITLIQSELIMFWNEDEEIEANVVSNEQAQMLEQFAFHQSLKAKLSGQDALWLQALSTPGGLESYSTQRNTEGSNSQAINSALALLTRHSFEFIQGYASRFNHLIVDNELVLTPSDMGEIAEATESKRTGSQPATVRYLRWRIASCLWSLNARASGRSFEIFLVPAQESVSLTRAELDFRLKAKLELVEVNGQLTWMADALPVSAMDIRAILRSCFRDLVRTTITDLQLDEMEYDDQPELTDPHQKSMVNILQHMKQIAMEKQNLAQKIVSQQEEIQRRIARDLHDAVIADVTMLKRAIDGDTKPSNSEIVKSLEEVSGRLREICYDLSPSDLRDWGLQTTLEALLDHVSQRTGAECSLLCEANIPVMDGSVELHVFRILQECLNNSAKYSGASYICITIETEGNWVSFRVEDNGRGFDSKDTLPKVTKEGGMGMGSMQERTQLIQMFYPAKLEVVSTPGSGTITRLSIKLSSMNSNEA